jgi:hypothetical protein
MSVPCTRESMHIPISVIIWFLYNLEYITILVTKHMIVQHGKIMRSVLTSTM